ncbi:protein kinase subdomain-containing protein [Colletotrichum plurivorum]|uniref:Protein kinase subdomain-containing protein n=1 Tax=Colletotrichum plurivorum TaxID=2175906 RepID=A0A8H6K657_9PEZI|nr:protein kinase subdomain-containing protein [Colletotrichum plurivorum]
MGQPLTEKPADPQPTLWPEDDVPPSNDGVYILLAHKQRAREHGKVKETTAFTAKEDNASETWFRSPTFDQRTVDRIKRIQFCTQAYEKGGSVPPSGLPNTWFELAIVAGADRNTARKEKEEGFQKEEGPRKVKEVVLTWKSHGVMPGGNGKFLEARGQSFGKDSDLVQSLKKGDSIAVRLHVRFKGWEINAQKGYLVIELGHPEAKTGVEFGSFAADAAKMDALCRDLNEMMYPDTVKQPHLPEGTFAAWQRDAVTKAPLRVLALDGGGVRGLASLRILDKVMTKAYGNNYEHPDGCSSQCAHERKCIIPSQIFDMIAGTSTGGLIAIMLGRLGLGVKKCLALYKKNMPIIFPPGKWEWINGWKRTFDGVWNGKQWDHTILESVIKEIIEARFPDEKSPMEVPLMNGVGPKFMGKARCKVFVTAVSKKGTNNHGPVLLRSYVNPTLGCNVPTVKLWEACRATSAAPGYFKDITVKCDITKEQYTFVDGGLLANNPLGWVWNEILTTYGPYRSTSCFLSIGTGVSPDTVLPDLNVSNIKGAASALASILTNTEMPNIMFRSLINHFAPSTGILKYFRFSVADSLSYDDFFEDHGERDIRLEGVYGFRKEVDHGSTGVVRQAKLDEATKQSLDKIDAQVEAYINGDKALRVVIACAAALNPKDKKRILSEDKVVGAKVEAALGRVHPEKPVVMEAVVPVPAVDPPAPVLVAPVHQVD